MKNFRTVLTPQQAARLPKVFWRRPDYVIGSVEDPYLLRWWILPRNPWFNIYLHNIRRDDDDRALHDHPWVNVSVVLKGSLKEVRAGKAPRRLRRFVPYFRRPCALHRLEVGSRRDVKEDIPFPKNVWTIFITGPRVREWGFQCPQSSAAGGWRHWKDFVGENPGEIGRGCGETSLEMRDD